MSHQENLKGSNSLLAKHFTPDVEAVLVSVRTSRGFGLNDVVRSGIENPDSGVGDYVPDEESYSAFSSLIEPVVEEYHGFSNSDSHQRDFKIESRHVGNPDPTNEYVVSTRIRVGRNLAGIPFAPGISKEERNEVERQVVEALNELSGDLSGSYHSLGNMEEEIREQLVNDHFLFKQGDRFLESAGANRDWPDGRGIFHSEDKCFLVWINEEDQLRIISMEQGGNVASVFSRLIRALEILEKRLAFAYSEKYGFLSSCPTNLGTAMRASVHIKVPNLEASGNLKALCDELGLSVRGIHGEHSESEGGVYDISNKKRLGISEAEIAEIVCIGIEHLIDEERKLASAD
jgi:arginine kinase